ncbi:hypothetical protein ACZ75_24165 [Massilia sp. NR 4-1]|nr:hypothetical protein ACZ75_24165 [Massilia sp. NR 4-1]
MPAGGAGEAHSGVSDDNAGPWAAGGLFSAPPCPEFQARLPPRGAPSVSASSRDASACAEAMVFASDGGARSRMAALACVSDGGSKSSSFCAASVLPPTALGAPLTAGCGGCAAAGAAVRCSSGAALAASCCVPQ